MPDSPPYLAQAQMACDVIARSVALHGHALVHSGFLGENPSEECRHAALFEAGCLHLFLLDRELRKNRRDDAILNELWTRLGLWLLEIFPGKAEDNRYQNMLSWRLGRYHDVAPRLEAQDTYEAYYAGSLLDTYLHTLAQQLLCCLSADSSAAKENGLYLGTVEDSLFTVAISPLEMYRHVGAVKETLYEFALPLQQIAALWAEGQPFYDKPVEELQALAQEGALRATQLWEKRRADLAGVHTQIRWSGWHDDGARFMVVPPSGAPVVTRQDCDPAIEYDAKGLPYLRLRLDPHGAPLRRLLLLAYDLGVGVIASDPTRDGDRPRDLPLSLGGVTGLLRYGSDSFPHHPPDLSDLDRLRVSRPEPWNLSGAARSALHHIFRRLLTEEAGAGREEGQQKSGQDFFAVRKRRPSARNKPVQAMATALPLEPRIGWVEDPDGGGALIVAPATQEQLENVVSWLLPPGSAALAEAVPKLAQYPVFDQIDYEDPGTEGIREAFEGVALESAALTQDAEGRFVRLHQVVYGAAGEPYEVVRSAGEDEVGQPLLYFALPCYDLGRGIALRAAHGALAGRLAFGEVVALLWQGAPSSPDTDIAHSTDADLSIRSPTTQVTGPHYLMLPSVTLRGIGWVLRRAGVKNPRLGCARADSGQTFLCLGPPPTPELTHWAQWRIGWYLPDADCRFAFVDDPALMPFSID